MNRIFSYLLILFVHTFAMALPVLNTPFSQDIPDINGDGKIDAQDEQALTWLLTKNSTPSELSVDQFRAYPSDISEGQASELRWNISGDPQNISIHPNIGIVTNLNRISVRPEVTTTYTLTAQNKNKRITASTTIYVKPTIISFQASQTSIQYGESITLSWKLSGTRPTSAQISPSVGQVNNKTTAIVQPTQTTTYTLKIFYAPKKFISRQITVKVKPKVISFTASPAQIEKDHTSTLRWRVGGEVTSMSIQPDVGDVTGLNSIRISPDQTTTYSLVAENQYGSHKKDVKVTVKDAPRITLFTGNHSVVKYVNQTTPVQLQWKADGFRPIRFSLSKKEGDTTTRLGAISGTQKTVYPTTDTTYILTATNSLGSAQASFDVSVLRIHFFRPTIPDCTPNLQNNQCTSNTIQKGTSSILKWNISGGDQVSLSLESKIVGENQVKKENVTGLTEIIVTPKKTTEYKLIANHPSLSGSIQTSPVKVTVAELPVIKNFQASNPILACEDICTPEKSNLQWEVTGTTTSIRLNKIVNQNPSLIESVDPFSSRDVTPTETTTYQLEATNNVGTVKKEVKVYVLKTKTFKATPQSIDVGQSSSLSWQIDGEPDTVLICSDHQTCNQNNTTSINVTNSSSLNVTPSSNTNYTLFAEKTIQPNNTYTIQRAITRSVDDKKTSVSVSSAPQIISFQISQSTITPEDGSVGLTWEVTGTTPKITISQTVNSKTKKLLDTFNSKSGFSVKPTDDTVYTLTATNALGSTSSQVIVYYLNIKDFKADPKSIPPNQQSTLSWKTTGQPDSVFLCSNDQICDQNSQTRINVTSLSSYTVQPSTTTTYTLIATKSSGDTTSKNIKINTKVTVLPPPVISSFTASPAAISCNGTCTNSTTLKWKITGIVTSISINQQVGSISPSEKIGNKRVTPSTTTTYTLTATNSSGSSSQNITVEVLNLESFSANPSCVQSGSSSTLSWKIDGTPTSLVLNGNSDPNTNNRNVSSLTSWIVQPTTTTLYTLTAEKIISTTSTISSSQSQQVNVQATCPTHRSSSTTYPTNTLNIIKDCSVCPKIAMLSYSLDSINNNQLISAENKAHSIDHLPIPDLTNTHNTLSHNPANIYFADFSSADSSQEPITFDRKDSSAFAVGLKPITQKEWQVCVEEEACEPINIDTSMLSTSEISEENQILMDHQVLALNSLKETEDTTLNKNQPITHITQQIAQQYTDWLFQKTGYIYLILEEGKWQSLTMDSFFEENTDSKEFHLTEPTLEKDQLLPLGFRVARQVD